MDEMFVLFAISCTCGTELHVHGQHLKNGAWGSRNFVACPKCKTEHDLPTKPLRFYSTEDGKVWRTETL
jgi:hypothetical protein